MRKRALTGTAVLPGGGKDSADNYNLSVSDVDQQNDEDDQFKRATGSDFDCLKLDFGYVKSVRSNRSNSNKSNK